MLDVLVIAPHPDDAEIGMGGSIALMHSQGLRLGILELTDGEPTPLGSRETRHRETEAATRVLGIQWRRCLGLPNRSLEHTLDARHMLASTIRIAKPQVLFAPFWEDAHPDHVVATELIEAARFWAKLSKSDIPGDPHWTPRVYYYFSVHLRKPEQPTFVLDISDHLDTKIRAVECFQSQVARADAGTGKTIAAYLRERAGYWGWTIGTKAGEPFASREPIGLTSLKALA